jgi:alkanesulfonate monooxygenase SsuD/methylene tetrahydromethanopterin reductase-like flavin-dependent oxidoreductase (luciferase family)
VEIGIHVEPEGAGYDVLSTLARVIEDSGFSVLAMTDHYLPHERPGSPVGPTDAWLTLAGLANQTSRITLSVLMVNPNFRHPSVLAVAMGQLAAMSGNRIEFGMGAGWYDRENEAFGLSMPPTWEARYDRRIEQIEVVRAIWAATPEQPATYSGAYYSLTGNDGLGAAADGPFPRLAMALTDAPRTVTDAVAMADEANIVFLDVDQTADKLTIVDTECDQQGRERGSLDRSVSQVICCGKDDAEIERRSAVLGFSGAHEGGGTACVGTPRVVRERLKRFEDLGISRVYLQIRDATDLDQVRLLGAEVLAGLT